MDYSTRLQQAAKKNEEAKLQKARLEQKLVERQSDLTKVLLEIKNNSSTQETLSQTIETLAMDIENSLESMEEAN